MYRYSLFAICALAIPSAAQADHDLHSLRRSYDAQRSEFTQAYHAQRRALRSDYHCKRDQILDERAFLARIDCPDTRARRLRANSRELSNLARAYSRQNQRLASVYHDGLDALRSDYELARADLRNGRRYQVGYAPVDHAHPAGCGCSQCVPPPPVVPHGPARVQGYHPYDAPRDWGRGSRVDRYGRRVEYRKPNGVDIAAAILSLLN